MDNFLGLLLYFPGCIYLFVLEALAFAIGDASAPSMSLMLVAFIP
jgi:hypothetical protein